MRLIGYVDGIEVKFDFYPPNTFKAEIPKKINGQYIIELHAIDDAGNQTNEANLIVAINFDKLTFKILEQDFNFGENGGDMGYREVDSQFTHRELIV